MTCDIGTAVRPKLPLNSRPPTKPADLAEYLRDLADQRTLGPELHRALRAASDTIGNMVGAIDALKVDPSERGHGQ